MLLTGKELRRHSGWMIFLILATVAATAGYIGRLQVLSDWPTGSDPYCFSLGVLAFVLIVFESLLWARKKLRTWRILLKPTKWMTAHIWLGLLTVPLVILHTGFHWGGPLANLLLVVFLAVIASGITGLILQQFVPRRLLRDVEHETIHSQIPRVVCYLRRDAERLIRKFNREFKFPEMPGDLLEKDQVEFRDQKKEMIIAGDLRRDRAMTQNSYIVSAPTVFREVLSEEHPLVQFAMADLEPFLSLGQFQTSALRDNKRRAARFQALRQRTSAAHVPVVDQLERICEERYALTIQDRWHFWLHAWLFIHYPLTVVLLGLLLAHIYLALYYW